MQKWHNVEEDLLENDYSDMIGQIGQEMNSS